VVLSLVQEAVSAQTGEKSLLDLTYGHDGKGVFGCGESFPLESAKSSRRVDIVFFEKGKAPALAEPTDRNALLTHDQCPVYDAERTEKREVPIGPVTAGLTIEVSDMPQELPDDIFVLEETGSGTVWRLPVEEGKRTDEGLVLTFPAPMGQAGRYTLKVEDSAGRPVDVVFEGEELGGK
jgi:hypothetical protein